MVFGYPWIREHRPVCNWESAKWRWPLTDRIELLSPSEFYTAELAARSREHISRVHAVYYWGPTGVTVGQTVERSVNGKTHIGRISAVAPAERRVPE